MPALKTRTKARRRTKTTRTTRGTSAPKWHFCTATEFILRVPHTPGQLARVLETLATAKVNVLSVCGYGHDANANIHIVPDKEEAARTALRNAGFQFDEGTIVLAAGPSGRGTGAMLARRLANAAINIEYAEATTTGKGDSLFTFKTNDPQAAITALKTK
jgi:hypothetical protein